MIRLVLVALLSWLALAATPAVASPLWTFCVASALGSKEVWITGLFSAGAGRDRLERELTSLLERTAADELMLTAQVYALEDRARSFELIADKVAGGLAGQDAAPAH